MSGRPGTKVFAYPGDGINGILAAWGRAILAASGRAILAASGRAILAASGRAILAASGRAILAAWGRAILAAWGRADNGPTFIQARHEEMAAFEAVGYAKFTGGLAVCMATSGSGPAPSGSYAAVSQAIPAGRHGPAGTRSG